MILRPAPRLQGDEGLSMMELLIGMLLMTIFGGLFTSAIVLMNNSANKVEAVTVSSTALNNAFASLDKTVRYAATITTPGTSTGTGDWYVEIQNTNTGVETCTQLRLDISSAQLQRRTWTPGANNTATGLTAWVPLASSLTNASAAAGSADQPFVLTNPTGNGTFQTLGFVLVAQSGTTASTTSRSTVTFAAVNSAKISTSGSTSSQVPCQQVTRP